MARGTFLGSLALVAALVPAGCAGMVGVDGEYVLAPETAPGSGGEAGSGGGATGSGGDTGGGATGSGGDTGGGATCAGAYTGRFAGVHRPSITVVGVTLPITGGNLSFTLPDGAGPLSIVDGRMSGTMAWGSFEATFTGTVDCDAGTLQGRIAGTISAIPVVVGIEGEISGPLVGGTWSEAETQAPGATGNGDWSANRTTP